ncbi:MULTISPECIES: FadR/GntR family transcriptional regulator [Kocuria]|uniref:Glc operon transcriptional activator n=1 Tax=Kocuria varians TaxID=1272 RepID=A0A7D7KYQ0_KOCVA|nr:MULTISPECIES: GntR family transcriptional regulator [Kocuria]QMS55575.1 Glc operon transcriptional activator [Kocuria varians]RUP84406.1 FadR family transcriptional regulator [Kocuria sp. HSID17590]RUQ08997.1 FadR family transcriptional regulator [Kocuria sp. HSID17582]
MSTAPAYTVVLDWLETQLRSGELRVGDKLPAERTLAEDFGISRASVREAVRILAAMGLVRSATGSGPQSGATVISDPSAALGWALRMHIATRSLPVGDVVSTRVLLETQSSLDAARSDVPERTAVLEQATALLDRMDRPDVADAEFHCLDAQFHFQLASLGGNVVLETIMASLREATIGYVQETVAATSDWPGVRAGLQHQHREILRATLDREGELAARLLREHILWFYALVPDEAGSTGSE